MVVSFVLSFFPRDVLDEILNLIESVSDDFPSYSSKILLLIVTNTLDYISPKTALGINIKIISKKRHG